MKKSSWFRAALVATAFVVVAPTASANFKDVNPNSEIGKAVQPLVDRGIVSGYPDGTFRPNQPITRSQMAKILSGALDLYTDFVFDPEFSDVPETHPNFYYIAALQNYGIVDGSNGKFNPSNPVTRGQMAKMLSNAYKLQQGSMDLPFTDIGVSSFAPFIANLYHNGITTGITATKYGINNPVTRGQLVRFIERVEKIRPFGSQTLSAESLGYEGPFTITVEGNDGYAEIVSYPPHYTTTIIPQQEGTFYIETEPMLEEDTDIYTYRVDIYEEDGTLKIDMIPLSGAEMPDALYFFQPGEDVDVYDSEGYMIDSELYDLQMMNDGDRAVRAFTHTLPDGEYRIVFHNGAEALTQVVISINEEEMAPEILGYYTNTNSIVLSYLVIDYYAMGRDYRIVSDDDFIEFIEKVENGTEITFADEGNALFDLVIDGRVELPNETMSVRKFGDGYVVDFGWAFY